MKILVFHFPHASRDILFGEEELINLSHLMNIGSYGFLHIDETKCPSWLVLSRKETDNDELTLVEYLIEAGKECFVIGNVPETLIGKTQNPDGYQNLISGSIPEETDDFHVLKKVITTQSWDYCQFHGNINESNRLKKDTYLHFDTKMGEVLGLLEDETMIVFVAEIADEENSNFYVLAVPNNPIMGERETKEANDLPPTILELAGYPLPEKIEGESWVAGMDLGDNSGSGLTEEEEAILRERLSGLGYI